MQNVIFLKKSAFFLLTDDLHIATFRATPQGVAQRFFRDGK